MEGDVVSSSMSRRRLWPALGVWLIGCVLLGYVCFVYLGRILAQQPDRYWAAVWWQLAFALTLGVILLIIVGAQRRRGESLRELGWRKPTSRSAIAIGIALGGLYTMGVYAGIAQTPSMQEINPLTLDSVRFALIPVGIFMAVAEEVMMRGYFMTELQRAGIRTPAQVLLSGACSAVYHSFHNPTLIGFVPSFVLFTMHAALFVYGGRSLTPSCIAHSLYHVLGAPYLLMFAMTQMQVE